MTSPETLKIELLALNQRLLNSIADGNWSEYESLCDASITCFEPEAIGHLVHGMEFHHFYFKLAGGSTKPVNTIVDPHVRIIGDAAIISYFRLVQGVDGGNGAFSKGVEETRVWQKINGAWKHVHFHRSPART